MSVPVTCPRCAQETVFDEVRKTADHFCPNCDYPLFWAGPPGAAASDDGGTYRRLPGAEGRETIGDRACGNCGERNSLTRERCIRCGEPLLTAPPEPPVPLPWPAPHEPPPPPPDPRRWPLFVAIGLLVLIVFLVLGEIFWW